MVAAFADHLWAAVVEGYGSDLVGIDYDSPDAEMLRNLQNNVYQFSAAKNYQQMKHLTQALIGEDGKLLSWGEFKKAAFKINSEQVKHWLKAEYDTAIASAQMASKWVQVQSTKDRIPYLEFDAVMDERTSDLCRNFNGVLLPADDPFWDQYYPPNHFRCRSTVRQRSEGKISDPASIVYPEKLPEMFKVNLGQRGLVFPPDHPYWEGTPDSVLKESIKLMPYDSQFEVLKTFDNGGSLRRHYLADQHGDEYRNNYLIGLEKATAGDRVDMMPIINEENSPWRKIIFPDAIKSRVSPDYRINGELTELKNPIKPQKFNTLKKSASDGARQAKRVIVKVDAGVDEITLFRIANGRFIDHPDLEFIEFRLLTGEYKRYSNPKKKPGNS